MPHPAGCKDTAPAMPASHGGSQVFIYHASAVEAFREKVLTPWFVAYAAEQGTTIDPVRPKAGVLAIKWPPT